MSNSRQGEVPHEFIKDALGLSDASFEHVRRNPELLSRLGLAAVELIAHAKELELEKARRRAYQARLETTEAHLVDAETDEVMGLLNRKAFLRAAHELDLSAGYLAVMMDLKGVKAINDKLGHPVGDVVLNTAARTLVQKGVRSGSVLGRWGGDEIAMVIPVDEQMDSEIIMRRLYSLFDGSETAELCAIGEGKAIRLSARFGYSVVEGTIPPSKAIDKAIAQADLIMVEEASGESSRGIMPPLVQL